MIYASVYLFLKGALVERVIVLLSFVLLLPPTAPLLAMANQEEPFDYFQDDDFLFDDNVFDAIDRQESIYLSTQQPPDPVQVQEESPNQVPAIEVTYRDPPPRTTDTSYSLRADDTTSLQWQSGLGQVESTQQEASCNIPGVYSLYK